LATMKATTGVGSCGPTGKCPSPGFTMTVIWPPPKLRFLEPFTGSGFRRCLADLLLTLCILRRTLFVITIKLLDIINGKKNHADFADRSETRAAQAGK
jgi:hypothetical protein